MSSPTITYPDLPVSARRDDILAALGRHRVLILCGETGSGKTTQIPKLCLEAALARGIGLDAVQIGCTQPRRIAARSVAARIASELGGELGARVGYKVRFTDTTRKDALIKVMTDGILLAETQTDPLLARYTTLIIDEAHERSLNIDFLLGYLKTLLDRRADLQLVITSATLDAEKFARHFGGAPVIEVSGRTYPVEIRWRPVARDDAGGAPAGKAASPKPRSAGEEAREAHNALITAMLEATDELAREGAGDILVFLPGEREIRDAAEALRKHHPPGTEILPLFSRLSVAEQDAIFRPSGALRRIVLATNVAETSLTVPGIRFVIDTGLARIKRYSPRNKVEQLLVEKIAQSSANQRAGRCGRVMDGVCIRLYDEADFQTRPRYTDPELLRSSLAGVILRMKSLGLGDVVNFPFIDPPGTRAIADGYQLLAELGALDETGALTRIGRQLARLPLDPRIGRMLLAAEEKRCLAEVLVIASALSVQDPRDRPLERAQAADEKHRLFRDERSDFMGWLKLWAWYDDAIRHRKSSRQLSALLAAHFLSARRMREWREVHGQLATQVAELGFKPNTEPAGYEAIHQALIAGLLGNIGFKADEARARARSAEGAYLGARGIRFGLHPGSALAKKQPKWVIAAELTDTGRLMARTVGEVRPEWIEAAARPLLTRMHSEPHWDARVGAVMAYERVSLYGVTLASRRRVAFAAIDPPLAREIFIRAALVAGEYTTDAPWFAHNRALIAEIEALEHKARKSGVWLDEARIFRAFETRLPAGIADARSFERWRRDAEAANPRVLYLAREDIVGEGLGVDATLFPETLDIDGIACPLKYRFEPGHPLDGVTLHLPLYLLNRVEASRLDWLVPGLIRDKVGLLMKGLPKPLRQALMPLPEAVTAFLTHTRYGEAPLREALARFLRETRGLDSRAEDWKAGLPPHLEMNLRVFDDAGEELAAGRDLAALRARLGDTARLAYSAAGEDTAFARSGIQRWDFGELPESVVFQREGRTLTGHPALVDTGEAVDLRLIDEVAVAARETRRGVLRLMRLALAAQFRQIEKDLARETALGLRFRPFGSAETLRAQLADAIADRALLGEDPLPRNARAFEAQLARGRARLPVVMQALLREVADILDRYARLSARLAQKSPFVAVWRDESAHLARLVPRDFIVSTPWNRLKDLPRYLAGIEKRLDKLPASEARDARAMASVQSLEKPCFARLESAGEPDAAWCEFRWQLEELRISLFAQELKTPYPVSVKRLSAAWMQLVARAA